MRLRKRTLMFALIGVANTLIDIGLFFLLTNASVPIFIANIISTGIALVFSYVCNQRITFKDRLADSSTIAKFFIVTLIGLWALQPLVIYAGIGVIHHIAIVQSVFGNYDTLVGKLAATAASMVWNFLLYDRFVFKHER